MSVMRILKDWTLPVAMGLGAVFYLVFAFVPALDGVATALAPAFGALLPPLMFLVLFVTFCKVNFRQMRPVWWHAWVLAFNLLFVALTMAAILLLPSLRLGSPDAPARVLLESLLMCIIAPCATAAAVVTQKLGGSLEQSTTYTFLSNFVTALLVPVCFPLIEQGSRVSFLAAFHTMFWQVTVLLLVPMLLAYLVKHHLPALHRRITAVSNLSFYLWAVTLMIVTGTTVKNIVHAQAPVQLLAAIALLALAFCVVQFAVGRYIGHFFGRTQEAGQALGQKNTTFAIWLSITYLNPLSSVGPGCYILWQNTVNSIEIWQKQRQQRQR